MRAVHVRENLAGLRLQGEELDRVVREALGAELVATIEASPRLRWLPLQIDIRMTHLVYEHGGDEVLRARCQQALLASGETPLMRGFITAGLRIFRGNPGSLFKLARRGYSQIYRNAGSLEVEPRDDTSVFLVGQDFPDIIRSDRIYLQGVGEAIAAVTSFVRFRCTSTLQRDAGSVRWVMQWRPMDPVEAL